MSDIHAKTGQILNRGSALQIVGSAGGGYDITVAIKVRIWVNRGKAHIIDRLKRAKE